MGTLEQAIQHGVGQGRFTQIFVPVIHRELAGDQGGFLQYSIINDFQQIADILGIHRGKPPPIVQDEEIDLGYQSVGLSRASLLRYNYL